MAGRVEKARESGIARQGGSWVGSGVACKADGTDEKAVLKKQYWNGEIKKTDGDKE